MNKILSKFQPLSVLVVLMAFFLSGCDQVLETFYPDFAAGKSFSTSGLTLTLSVDKSLAGNVVVSLVPYDFDANAGSSGAVVASLKNVVPLKFKPADLTSASYTTTLTLIPGKTYRLVAYQEDAATANTPAKSTNRGATDKYVGTVISVNGNDLFTPDDVKNAGGKVSGNIGSTTYLPNSVYFELFGSATQKSAAFSVTGPDKALDLADKVAPNLNLFTFDRPFDWANQQVAQVKVDVTGPKVGFTSFVNKAVTIPAGTERGGSMALPDVKLTVKGIYKISVHYWFAGDDKTVASTHSSVELNASVVDTSKVVTSTEPYNLSLVGLKVNVKGLATSQYVYISYTTPPNATLFQPPTYADSTTTMPVDLGQVPYYDLLSNVQHGTVLVDVYDNTGFLYTLTSTDKAMGMTRTQTSLTVDFTIAGTTQPLPYTVNVKLTAATLGLADKIAVGTSDGYIYIDYFGSDGSQVLDNTGFAWDQVSTEVTATNFAANPFLYHPDATTTQDQLWVYTWNPTTNAYDGLGYVTVSIDKTAATPYVFTITDANLLPQP